MKQKISQSNYLLMKKLFNCMDINPWINRLIVFLLSLYSLWLILMEISHFDGEWILNDSKKYLLSVDDPRLYWHSDQYFDEKIKFQITPTLFISLLKIFSMFTLIASLFLPPIIKLNIFAYMVIIYNLLLKTASYITSICQLYNEILSNDVKHFCYDILAWLILEICFVYFTHLHIESLILNDMQKSIAQKFIITNLLPPNKQILSLDTVNSQRSLISELLKEIPPPDNKSTATESSDDSLLSRWLQFIQRNTDNNGTKLAPAHIPRTSSSTGSRIPIKRQNHTIRQQMRQFILDSSTCDSLTSQTTNQSPTVYNNDSSSSQQIVSNHILNKMESTRRAHFNCTQSLKR